jgi:hypothetical protein
MGSSDAKCATFGMLIGSAMRPDDIRKIFALMKLRQMQIHFSSQILAKKNAGLRQ